MGSGFDTRHQSHAISDWYIILIYMQMCFVYCRTLCGFIGRCDRCSNVLSVNWQQSKLVPVAALMSTSMCERQREHAWWVSVVYRSVTSCLVYHTPSTSARSVCKPNTHEKSICNISKYNNFVVHVFRGLPLSSLSKLATLVHSGDTTLIYLFSFWVRHRHHLLFTVSHYVLDLLVSHLIS